MFKNKAKPTKIYKFGVKAPVENADIVHEQLFNAHRYRNKLVELELERRRRSREIAMKVHPAYADAEAAFEAANDAVEKQIKTMRNDNSENRALNDNAGDNATLKRVQQHRKELYTVMARACKEAYKLANEQKMLTPVAEWHKHATKRARAECGVYWGTYLQVEQALCNIGKGAPPTFKRWCGEGKIAVQIQKGMPVAEAFTCTDSRFRIERTGGKWDKAYVRVGSEGRAPVWAVFPVRLHRDMPEDARITWVYVTARKIATKTEWSLCIVLSREDGWTHSDVAVEGTVGVDLGWRIMDEGMRVAVYYADDGSSGELIIPNKDLSRWKKASDLRSIRDKNQNAMYEKLKEWLTRLSIPEWLQEKAKYMHLWVSPAQFAALALHWRDNRFDRDSEVFTLLENWRKQDKHLYEWERNQERKAVAWRNDLYRNFAAKLSRRYAKVIVEDANWADIARKEPVKAKPRYGASNQRISSPGKFREFLEGRFRESERVASEYTTKACHVCGAITEFDAAKKLMGTCVCGVTWDQDHNAARNLLASGAVGCKSGHRSTVGV